MNSYNVSEIWEQLLQRLKNSVSETVYNTIISPAVPLSATDTVFIIGVNNNFLKKWLEEKEIEFEQRDIKEEKPTAEELKTWWRKSGLPLKRFFNTSGKLYKEMQLKDRIPNMSEDEQIELLASDGMLVKRPILVQNEKVLVGFKEKEWQEIL